MGSIDFLLSFIRVLVKLEGSDKGSMKDTP